jgi:4-amino-4-deoxychorismate lyase
MCHLIETIKVSGKQFLNIACHNGRMNHARLKLFGNSDKIDIAQSVRIPADLGEGVYKCTVTYSRNIVKAEFSLYSIRKIRSLKAVHCNSIEYEYKYADRSLLNSLLQQRMGCDEIIIVKDGKLTDTSFSNIILYDGSNWVTPDTPLLKGTKREKLLREGFISEASVSMSDLNKFDKVSLINSMLDPGDIIADCRNILA